MFGASQSWSLGTVNVLNIFWQISDALFHGEKKEIKKVIWVGNDVG